MNAISGFLLVGLSLGAIAEGAAAQVTSDGNLGTVVTGSPNFVIDGGTRPGGGPNLFHSFSQFSVPTGGSASFNNAPDVVNIFGRVTGGNVSTIDGVIAANGAANLFLINPAGIIFGRNAQLNIGGSFIGTTANSVKFSDGTEFTATNPVPALLTINVPIGLQMGSNPSAIVNQSIGFAGSGLEVSPGQSFLLVGGNLQFQSGRARAAGGRIELAGIAGAGTVGLIPDGAAWRLGVPPQLPLGDITFADIAGLSVAGQGGGEIVLRGQNVSLVQNSFLSAGISPPGASDRSVRSGDITINAPGSLTLNNSRITNTVTSRIDPVIGTSGDVNIKTGAFSLINGGQISLGTDRSGDGGTANIQANTVLISGTSNTGFGRNSGIYNRVSATGIGRTGDINVTADSITIDQRGQISASMLGQGQVGSINLSARQITIDGSPTATLNSIGFDAVLGSSIFNTVGPGAQGSSGDINITANSLRLVNGGQVQIGLQGRGTVGNVNIQAQDVSLDGGFRVTNGFRIDGGVMLFPSARLGTVLFPSAIRTLVETNSGAASNPAIDNGGNINISSNSLVLTNGGTLESANRGNSKAGNINLTSNTIVMEGALSSGTNSGAFSNVEGGAAGNGGTIRLNTDSLTLLNGAQVSANTNGPGNAGTIQATATADIRLAGSNPLNAQMKTGLTSASFSAGQGGSMAIATPRLVLEEGAEVKVSALSNGNAGNLLVNADRVTLNTGASLRSEVNTGTQGNITLFTNTLDLDNAAISSASSGSGKAGDLNLTSQSTTLLNGSEITTRSLGSGDGGTVQFTGESLTLQNADVKVSALSNGNAGNLLVNTERITLNTGASLRSEVNVGTQGNITLLTNTLDLDSAAAISSTSSGSGKAGNLNLTSQRTTLRNDSEVATRSLGSGDGGTVQFTGESLILRNNASINASTAAGNGGNLIFNLSGLLDLRDLSRLTAEASGTGNGGNITIDALFVLGFGNSDIIVKALRGNGGNIQIATQGIYGLQFRPQLTPLNDITASSQLGVNKTLQINNVTIDPSSNFGVLPPIFDANQQIVTGCDPNQRSRFVVTGRGGIPTNPTQKVRHDRPWADTRDLSALRTSAPAVPAPTDRTTAPLIQATNWRRNPQTGKVELYAETVATAASTAAATCAIVNP